MTVPSEAIAPAIEQVLQNMYFCEALYSGPGSVAADSIGAAVRFSGSAQGEFRVAIRKELAERMTSDFLALDHDSVSVAQVESAVREFANIACGAALSAWKPSANFRFSVPEDIADNPGKKAGESSHFCFSESGEGSDIGVSVRIDSLA
jgi:hypothetical protein